MEEIVDINPQQKFTESQITIQPEVLKVQHFNNRDSSALSCHAKMNPDLIKPKCQTTNKFEDKFSCSDYTYQNAAKNEANLKQALSIVPKQSSIKKINISKVDKQTFDQKQNNQNFKEKKQEKHRSLRPSHVKNIQSIILQKPTPILQIKDKSIKHSIQASQIQTLNQKKQDNQILLKIVVEETQKFKKRQNQNKILQVNNFQIKKKEPLKLENQSEVKKSQNWNVLHHKEQKQKKLQNIQNFKSPIQSHRQMQKNEVNLSPKYQEIKLQPEQKQESSYSMMKTDNFQKPKQAELKKQLEQLQPIQILKQFQFFMKPIKSQDFVSLSFQRHKNCMLSEPISFHINESSSMQSIKSSRMLNSTFIISAKRFGIESECAILKSNFFGTIYNLTINGNEKDIICSIIFNDMKTDTKVRSVQIYVKQNISQAQPFDTLKLKSYSNLKELYHNEQAPFSIKKFQSKAPFYDQKTKSYVMNFNIKKQNILQSVKNTILIDQNGQDAFKFCKNSFLTYKVMFKKPFSWLVAYAYALASTDFKILTQ